MSSEQPLSKLNIPGMTPLEGYDGQVTEPVEGVGLRAQVVGHQNYNVGDKLEVFWNDVLVLKHTITAVEEAAGVAFYVGKNFITPGDVAAHYTLTDNSGNTAISPPLKLKVNPAR
ncbi:hypothetical protein ACYZT8_22510 [Pseudomonas sp. LB3P93]|jgi:hypothetical protein